MFSRIRKPLISQVFGRLIVIDFVDSSGSMYLCRCECGKEKEIHRRSLTTGLTRSCGCLCMESSSLANLKHGMHNSPTYQSWQNMKSRCDNPNNPYYHNYGGRGITVCKEWQTSFKEFLKDMGNRPSISYSIERVNNDLGYTRDNCRWATKKEQGNNKRTNRKVEYNGAVKNVGEWSEFLSIPLNTIVYHLNRGKSIGDIMARRGAL